MQRPWARTLAVSSVGLSVRACCELVLICAESASHFIKKLLSPVPMSGLGVCGSKEWRKRTCFPVAFCPSEYLHSWGHAAACEVL